MALTLLTFIHCEWVSWSKRASFQEKNMRDARQVSKHRSLNQMSLSTVFVCDCITEQLCKGLTK